MLVNVKCCFWSRAGRGGGHVPDSGVTYDSGLDWKALQWPRHPVSLINFGVVELPQFRRLGQVITVRVFI